MARLASAVLGIDEALELLATQKPQSDFYTEHGIGEALRAKLEAHADSIRLSIRLMGSPTEQQMERGECGDSEVCVSPECAIPTPGQAIYARQPNSGVVFCVDPHVDDDWFYVTVYDIARPDGRRTVSWHDHPVRCLAARLGVCPDTESVLENKMQMR